MSHADFSDLQRWIEPFGSALIAYSGGVDSALVMAAAQAALGAMALACIAVSPSYPQRELAGATALAGQLGVACRLVQTQEHLDPRYAANPINRCYFCKSDLYDRLVKIKNEEHWSVIFDGTHAGDPPNRAGFLAAKQRGVRSPLLELQLTKQDVRALARQRGLPVWDKPAMPCLSSRVPQGVTIRPELLQQIEQAEDALVKLGFRQFRVRHHGETARIELPPVDMPRALEWREAIVNEVRAAGYRFVTLDLVGYRGDS